MGSIIQKCKACLEFMRPQQQGPAPIHHLVNLSKNPDISDIKVDPHQISFVEKSQDNISITQQSQKDQNDVTIEGGRHLSAKSPSPNSPNEKVGMLLQEEFKTNQLDPMDILSPGGKVVSLASLQTLSLDQLNKIGLDAVEQFIYELSNNDEYEEIPSQTMNLQLRWYQTKQKRFVTQVKASFVLKDLQLNDYIEWSNRNENSIDPLIGDYELNAVADNVRIGKCRYNKHLFITPKEFQFMKYTTQQDEYYIEVYKSVQFEDEQVSPVKQGFDRGYIVLGGIQVKQVDGDLHMQCYSDIDLSIRLPYQMTKKSIRERIHLMLDRFKNQLQ